MYLLDANVLIEASRTYYSASLAPSFWDWLTEQHLSGAVGSVAKVREEIFDGEEGHLTKWSRALPATFWLAPGQESVPSMQFLAEWTMHPDRHYWAAARADFLSKADYFLVAQAHAGGHVLVTS